HCQATPIKMVCPDNPLRETITAEGPIALAEMFKVGDSVIDDPPAVTCVTVAANRADQDAIRPHVNRAASVAASERFDRTQMNAARKVAADAFARAGQRAKARTLMVATAVRLGEKQHGKAPAELKIREPRTAARGSEGHRDWTRHRGHVA